MRGASASMSERKCDSRRPRWFRQSRVDNLADGLDEVGTPSRVFYCGVFTPKHDWSPQLLRESLQSLSVAGRGRRLAFRVNAQPRVGRRGAYCDQPRMTASGQRRYCPDPDLIAEYGHARSNRGLRQYETHPLYIVVMTRVGDVYCFCILCKNEMQSIRDVQRVDGKMAI